MQGFLHMRLLSALSRTCFSSNGQIRGFVSYSRQGTDKTIWEELFQDPSQFYDLRNDKKSHSSPDFRHKRTGKVLWVDGIYTPPWVHERLLATRLSCFQDNTGHDSIIHLIKSCDKKKDILTLRALVANKPWITDDLSIANTLIRSFAKCGAMKEAQEVFDQLQERDVVSWNAVMAGYIDQGLCEKALKSFQEMENNGTVPNKVTYVCILKVCAMIRDLEIVQDIHIQVREKGLLNKHIILGNSLINAYFKCDAVKEACQVFDLLPKRNVASWNALINGYAEQGLGQEALKCIREMKMDGMTPDSVTYACSLKACVIGRDLEILGEIYGQVKEEGLLDKHILVANSLVNAYVKCGALKEAQDIFDQLVEKDVVSWNAIIAGYVEQGFAEEALTYLSAMENTGLTPDSVTYACILKACAIIETLEIVREIHAQVKQHGLLQNNIVVANSLVNAYVKCGALKEAQNVFDQLGERDVVSWNALIAGYVDHGFVEEAFACSREMERDGLAPDAVTYAYCLKACAVLGAIQIVEGIYAKLREEGLLQKDISLGTALVNAFSKCGAVKELWEVFNQLGEQSVLSWNAVLVGYAQFGCVKEMFKLLNRMMVEGIFADTVTFLVLLNGCSHGALLEEGKMLFYMIGTCGITPTTEHYTCMVDLFGRAGQFDMAKCFLIDHTPTLLAFLGACRKWANVDLGRWAFEKLLQFDRKCDSAYVCMANIYAAAGMTNEIEETEFLRLKYLMIK